MSKLELFEPAICCRPDMQGRNGPCSGIELCRSIHFCNIRHSVVLLIPSRFATLL